MVSSCAEALVSEAIDPMCSRFLTQPLGDKDNVYSNLPPILAVVIPILAIVMGIGYAMLAIWLRYQRRKEVYEMHHRERMLAIERGMEVPPLPPGVFSDFDHTAARALIPIAMGLANLGFYLAEGRSRPSGPGNPEPDGKPKAPGATPS
jgi:hypothetical protein